MAVKRFPVKPWLVEMLFRENFRLWKEAGPYDKYHAPGYGIQFDPITGEYKPEVG